jgi:DnaJ homolog subfamily C member 9
VGGLPCSLQFPNDRTGSQEEIDDIQEAYLEGEGDIEHIMSHIPHSTYEDEPRIITVVKKLIKSKAVASLPKWEADVKDEKAKKARKKRGQQEAVEAEETAKELGVWDEFYGSGSKGKRGGGGGKKKDQDDTANLQALIRKRAADRSTGSFLDNLAAKYGVLEDPMDEDEPPAPKAKSKGRKKRSREEEEDEGPTKKSRKTPELDDAEFERIQQRLEAQKAKRVK